MQEFPHHYQVATHVAGAEGEVVITGAGLPDLRTAPPVEFGGPGDRWSPETLLVAAVCDCFVLGFKAIADASRLTWTALDVQVTGTLDRIDRKMRFTHFASPPNSRCRPGRRRARRVFSKRPKRRA